MKKFFVNIICMFIPFKKPRHKLRNMLLADKIELSLVRVMKTSCLLPAPSEAHKAVGVLRDIQLANLKILSTVDEVCAKLGVDYWLDSGTALGAVRHGGFIPWDDDIDIGMLRDDFEEFVEKFNNVNTDTDLVAYYHICKAGRIIKIIHKELPLWVDIFMFDYYTKKTNDLEKVELTKLINKISNKKYSKREPVVADRSLIDASSKPTIIYAPEWDAHLFHMLAFDWETIFPLSTIEFEGKKFRCPADMDTYLTFLYRDYMSYPNYFHIHNDLGKLSVFDVVKLKKFIKK